MGEGDLAGRLGRLEDGTSRNPAVRDKLLAQRSKDLQGLIVQVRGLDLDEFLSDWEDPDHPIPWELGEPMTIRQDEPESKRDAIASAASLTSCLRAMAGAGVAPSLQVLYVPDYMPNSTKVAMTSKRYRVFSSLLPSYEVKLARWDW